VTRARGATPLACAGKPHPEDDIMAIRINPYLNFDASAEKAIKVYEKALGAKVEHLMRFGDAGEMGHPMPAEHKDRVMHAQLRIGDGVIMMSDCPPGGTLAHGNSTHVSIHFEDPNDMAKKFEALAEGGNVAVPLQDMFWGAKFGMLTDAFGISWLFHCELKKG
jgi:PhnB protein